MIFVVSPFDWSKNQQWWKFELLLFLIVLNININDSYIDVIRT